MKTINQNDLFFQILSAAHCFKGTHSMKEAQIYFTNGEQRIVQPEDVICHSSYEHQKRSENDICLIRIDKADRSLTTLTLGCKNEDNKHSRYFIGMLDPNNSFENMLLIKANKMEGS